ncbi:MAG: CYTH and CHAD domain-containing protein [Negativicutes bacterium]|nr:CYTH and CHAD domain-containing protein [Negativicutes bacterium]
MPENTHTEVELKLRLLDPLVWTSVAKAPIFADLNAPEPVDEQLDACYYDTSDHALLQAGVAFRIRKEDNQWIATVKAGGSSAGGLHRRQEWNVVIAEPQPSIEPFQATEAGPLLTQLLGDSPLAPLFRSIFDRRKTQFAAPDGSQIELAIDQGLLIAGERQEAFAEIELELKTGNPASLLAIGTELSRLFPLTVEPRSKFFRGLCLAGLEESSSFTERQTHWNTATTAGQVFRELLTDQLHQIFTAQEVFLQNANDHESFHQLRIQIRRLRSLLSFAKPLLEPAGCENWQTQLQNWSQTTNSLRETDVVLDCWQEIIADGSLTLTPPPWLELMLQTERSAQSTALADSLGQGQSTHLLLGFWAWLAGDAFLPAAALLPWNDFSISRLSARLSDMRKLSKELAFTDLTGLHQLRILGKKLRYTLERLPLKDRKTRILLARLKGLQDFLGSYRDTQILTQSLSGWLNTQASRVLYRDAGILFGWSARTVRDVRRDYDRTLRKFRRAARRWEEQHRP